MSLGRWDEALEVVEHALDLVPPPPHQASLQGFGTDIALARGLLDRAEKLLAASRRVLSRGKFREQTVLPHVRREVQLLLTPRAGSARPAKRRRAPCASTT